MSLSSHPVIETIRARPDGSRIALVVEGGGMRGAVTGGMCLALDELGLNRSFDAAYGSSAGALNSMWLLAGRVSEGAHTWTDTELGKELMSLRRFFSSRPVVDMERLVEERYEQLAPGLFADLLGSPTEFHPIATNIETGEAVDLHNQIVDESSLRKAIRASSALPLAAGPPVELNGGRYLDAGLSAAIPFRAAIADGATHILVLRSRQVGDRASNPSGAGGRLMTRLLGRISPAVAECYLTRGSREGIDETDLARHDEDPDLVPSILSVRPASGSAVPARLERDMDVVREGLESGHEALLEHFERIRA